MRNINLWIVALMVLFIFMLIISGALGIVVKKNSSTKNWKLFTNKEYGYSLKYPPSWGASTELLDNGLVLFSNPEYLKERIKNPQNFNKTDYAEIDISAYPYGTNTAGGRLEESTDIEKFAEGNYSDLILPGEKTTKNGNETYVVKRKNMILRPEYSNNVQNCPEENCYEEFGKIEQVWVRLPEGWLLMEEHFGSNYKDSETLLKTFQKITNTLQQE